MSASSRRKVGIVVAAVVFFTIGTLSFWQIVQAHRKGWTGLTYVPRTPRGREDRAAMTPTPFGWKAGSVIVVFPDSPASRAGIQPRDLLDAIEGVSTSDWEGLSRLDHRVHAGDRLVLRMRRNGVTRDVPIVLESELLSPLIGLSIFSSLVVAMVYFFIGIVVFWKRPDDGRVIVFFAVTLIAYVTFVGMPILQTASQRGIAPPDNLTYIPQLIFVAAIALLFAPTLLHLALVFPKPRPILHRRPEILRWIYAPVLLIMPVCFWMVVIVGLLAARKHTTAFWIGVAIVAAGAALAATGVVRIALRARRDGLREAFLRQPVWAALACELVLAAAIASFNARGDVIAAMVLVIVTVCIVGVVFAAYPICTIVALYRSYRDSGLEEKRQVKWPLWATIVALVVKLLVSTVLFVLNTSQLLQQKGFITLWVMQVGDLLPKLLYILIPLSFAFAIAKYRLMDIDLIVRRTATYGLLSAVVFLLYAILVAGVGTLLVRFAGVQNQAMVIASTIVVALVAVPLRNTLQRVVDRRVFRERVSYPLALRTLADAVSGGAVREELLLLLAEQLQRALQNRSVLVVMRSGQHFVATAKIGVADEVLGTFRVPTAGVELPRPVDLDRATLPQQLEQRLRRLGVTLLVPLRAQGGTIGFVALGAKLSNERFSAEDIEFLTAATSQVAMALETSRLRSEEADFEQARAMQQVLLPKALPRLDGIELAGMWQPARSVGGDYYDAIALDDGKAAVCIADVAGKGMPAALLTASLQAAVKATAVAETPPSRLCDKVRRVLSDSLAGGTFITFFYALLDANARTLTYCNAGHNPPILVRDRGEVERLDVGGSVLGRLFRTETYCEATVPLGAGDRIVLFTDGVSEARRADEDFGDERLIDVIRSNRHLPPGELQEKIVEAITSFTSGSFGDDVTLVVIGAN